jgi:hypothetical protein
MKPRLFQQEERIVTRNSKLFAAVMSVSVFAVPCTLRATQLFQDNFSNDTATFAYPDASGFHLPTTPSGPGSWSYNYANYENIQAGVITNTLPGGGTGGADGNSNYLAIQRSGGPGWAAADFASPAGTSGNLSVQWDMYDVGPGRNFQIFLSDAAGSSAPYGNNGPLIEASYFSPASSGDMELGTLAPSYNDLGGFPDNAWVHMDMEVNLGAETYQLLVNSVSEGTFAYYPDSSGPLKALQFYGASSANETLYVDNINVVYTPVPEPATLSLLSLGGLLAFRRPGRWRQR